MDSLRCLSLLSETEPCNKFIGQGFKLKSEREKGKHSVQKIRNASSLPLSLLTRGKDGRRS